MSVHQTLDEQQQATISSQASKQAQESSNSYPVGSQISSSASVVQSEQNRKQKQARIVKLSTKVAQKQVVQKTLQS